MTEVDAIAQGRVWSGTKAKELGLVDELGDLQTAIDAALPFQVSEHYDIKLVEKELSPMDKFLKETPRLA